MAIDKILTGNFGIGAAYGIARQKSSGTAAGARLETALADVRRFETGNTSVDLPDLKLDCRVPNREVYLELLKAIENTGAITRSK